MGRPYASSLVEMSSVRASLRLRYPDQRQRTSRRSPTLRMLPWRSSPWVGASARSRRARWPSGSPGSSATTSAMWGLSATRGAMARFVTYTSLASGWRRASARTSGVVSRMSPMEMNRTRRTHSTLRNKSCVARVRQSPLPSGPMLRPKTILWVDDEVEGLAAHRRFLEDQGFTIASAGGGVLRRARGRPPAEPARLPRPPAPRRGGGGAGAARGGGGGGGGVGGAWGGRGRRSAGWWSAGWTAGVETAERGCV